MLTEHNSRFRQVIFSEIFFALFLSAALVAMRILLFDHHFFMAHMLPSHDMSQGVSFFATNMHSMRLSGELAFWNPAACNGYAQYFQSFLSPLAPTPNNLVFIVWAEVIRFLSLFHIAFPEYFQYITFTYALAPFLTFVAATLFLCQLFEKRSIVALLMISYVFSAIGTWNAAWFYFQEQFMLFAVLGTAIAYCRKPTLTRLFLCLAALLMQACSANYWTVHNSWFYCLAIASYAVAFPNQIKRALNRLFKFIAIDKRKSAAVVTLLALSVGMWAACLGSMVIEQSKRYVRHWWNGHRLELEHQGDKTLVHVYANSESKHSYYPMTQALERVPELRRATLELFNPSLERAMTFYPPAHEGSQHSARYVGLVFLPFLLLFPLYAWRRKERFLAVLTLSTLAISMGFLIFGALWLVTPMMSIDQHLFYFYSQYLQLALIMAAAAALEMSVSDQRNEVVTKRMTSVTLAVVAVSFCAFAGYSIFSHQFPANDLNLQTALYSFTILVVVSILAAQQLISRKEASRRMLLAALLIVALLDLTTYFVTVNKKDADYSRDILLKQRYDIQVQDPAYAGIRPRQQETPLTAQDIGAHKLTISRAWAAPDLSKGFTAGLSENMPTFTDFWPIDHFLRSIATVNFHSAPLAVQDYEYTSAPIQLAQTFDPKYDAMHDIFIEPSELENHPDQEIPAETGLVNLDGRSLVTDRFIPGFKYDFRSWSYNGFKVSVDAPQDGLLIIHQSPDPLWKLKLDSHSVVPTTTRYVDMAVPVTSGHHELEMDYQPLSRYLYWPAAILLQLTTVLLLSAAYLSARRGRI